MRWNKIGYSSEVMQENVSLTSLYINIASVVLLSACSQYYSVTFEKYAFFHPRMWTMCFDSYLDTSISAALF